MTPTVRTNTTMRRKRGINLEFYQQPSGAGNEAQAPAGAARFGSGSPWLPVRRVPLLAGYPLYDLFPRPAAAREVMRCPVS